MADDPVGAWGESITSSGVMGQMRRDDEGEVNGAGIGVSVYGNAKMSTTRWLLTLKGEGGVRVALASTGVSRAGSPHPVCCTDLLFKGGEGGR